MLTAPGACANEMPELGRGGGYIDNAVVSVPWSTPTM